VKQDWREKEGERGKKNGRKREMGRKYQQL